MDLSHCSSKAKVTAHGKDGLNDALSSCQLVVIPAGVPRKPGMTRDDLFNINAGCAAAEHRAATGHLRAARPHVASARHGAGPASRGSQSRSRCLAAWRRGLQGCALAAAGL